MYISYEEYTALYDTIEAKLFNRLSYDACHYIDRLTTGADGVKKLKVAFPTDEYDADAVKRCAARVVYILAQIQEAEKSASLGRVLVPTENGLRGNVIASVSSGSESVAYSNGLTKSAVDMALQDPAARATLLCAEIREYLSGVSDANGVNLLYAGPYPA